MITNRDFYGLLLCWFLEKFILKDTLNKVIEIKDDDCNILKADKLIDIGYAAKQEIMKYKLASSGSAQHVALL